MAITICNGGLVEEMRRTEVPRQVRNLSALLEVSNVMVAEASLDSLLDVIVEKTKEVMEADRCTLFLHDESRNELWSKNAQQIGGLKEIRLPVGVGIAGDVARTRKASNIPDAYKDSRFTPEFDKKTGYRTRSILCLPLITSSGKLMGVIQVLNKKRRGHRVGVFSKPDEALMEALASHAAVALERAQLTEAYIEKQRMEQTLKVAHEIQMSMLPRKFPSYAEMPQVDLYAAMTPAKEVGGDFYDFFLLDDHHLFFAIGDVSGKGVPAALFMAVTKTLIKAAARKGLSPGEILSEVNAELCLTNESSTFVTIFCGILNDRTRELLYANGGHNPPFIVRQGVRANDLKQSEGTVVGVMEDVTFDTRKVRLKPGDSLFLYTDGVTEAMNSGREFFTEEQLKKEVMALQGESSKDVIEGIMQSLRKFSQGMRQADDITMVNLRMRSGTGRSET